MTTAAEDFHEALRGAVQRAVDAGELTYSEAAGVLAKVQREVLDDWTRTEMSGPLMQSGEGSS